MSKLELDDMILEHPKFVLAVQKGGPEVIFMWLALRAYCGQHLSDGFVPEHMINEMTGPGGARMRDRLRRVLTEVGLILDSTRDGARGITMHDFLDWSRSREQVLADRERARERQTKWRGGSNGGGGGGKNPDGTPPNRKSSRPPSRRDERRDSRGDNAVTNAVANGVTNTVTSDDVTPLVTRASASASASERDRSLERSDPDLAARATAEKNVVRRAGDPDLESRITCRPSEPGKPPAPRHDPAGERFRIGRWYPSQAILDWTRSEGLDERGFDEAIEDARLKLTRPAHLDWFDAKIIRFLEVAIAHARSKPKQAPRETREERERAEQEITRQRRAEVAAFNATHDLPKPLEQRSENAKPLEQAEKIAEIREALGRFTTTGLA